MTFSAFTVKKPLWNILTTETILLILSDCYQLDSPSSFDCPPSSPKLFHQKTWHDHKTFRAFYESPPLLKGINCLTLFISTGSIFHNYNRLKNQFGCKSWKLSLLFQQKAITKVLLAENTDKYCYLWLNQNNSSLKK